MRIELQSFSQPSGRLRLIVISPHRFQDRFGDFTVWWVSIPNFFKMFNQKTLEARSLPEYSDFTISCFNIGFTFLDWIRFRSVNVHHNKFLFKF